MTKLRRAELRDVPGMADIVNGWIDGTKWMLRVVPVEEIAEMLTEGLDHREIWVAGDPVQGYLSLDSEAAHIWGFYCAQPGNGIGKLLLDRAKQGRSFLSLNTHVPNKGAQLFYLREGFAPVGEMEEGVPSTLGVHEKRKATGIRELRMEWHA
ncbi:GNAT family N-acetyltransferase [Parasedimentitalea psychrophila]|uniref:GNAT family N-acetyltransferase n=1 Tax=Parasedimentitalea psychrophila TaxID=2997337 RepID=A0A9Y2L1Q8_9RHOB|nr:GNAT family N-acetyltransferase [Parasedimentitalea psychrophila]WIY25264.1 GNAT family N-acetyltransferase [Parasedimentitalea psychrophila]